jgi:predicted RNase H-like nuclease
MVLLGFDGCRGGGWVVARSDRKLAGIRFELCENLENVLRARPAKGIIAVLDVPIGLSRQPRDCDLAARQHLKHRRSSVFRPPCRETCKFAAHSEGSHDVRHRAASALNKRIMGRGISRQAFSIAQRIWEVDCCITPALQRRIREGHPELSFAVMRGSAMRYNKRTPEGVRERLRYLRAAGVPQFNLVELRRQLGRGCVAVDDVLDAAAMLWTAWRVARGTAVRFPERPSAPDARGLDMAIWA